MEWNELLIRYGEISLKGRNPECIRQEIKK